MDKDCRGYAIECVMPFVDSWLRCQIFSNRLPGIQYSAAIDGQVVVSKALGYANVETEEVLTPDHLFHSASHSKTFTALAVLLLLEQEKLRLDDSVIEYLPDLYRLPDNITIRDVLSHSSGLIRDGIDSSYWQYEMPWPQVQNLWQQLGDDPAIFGRYEKFKYSNVAFSLLGLVIEKITGKSYDKFIHDVIIAPLGLNYTFPDYDPDAGLYASGYMPERFCSPRTLVGHMACLGLTPATGLISTTADLCRFYSSLDCDNPRFLRSETQRLMQHRVWNMENENRAYGIGLWIYDKDTFGLVIMEIGLDNLLVRSIVSRIKLPFL